MLLAMDNSICRHADSAFGPFVPSGCRNGNDFTMQFEQLILTLLPASVFLVAISARVVYLWRVEKKCASNVWRIIKLITAAILAGFQLGILVLWLLRQPRVTSITIASSGANLLVALALVGLTWMEDARSIRPSTTINLYLFVTGLSDIPQTRTLWLLKSQDTIAVLFSAATATKLLLLVFESIEKRPYLLSKYQNLPYEATSGIINCSFMWWINKTFKKGYSHTLSMRDLHVLDPPMESAQMRRKAMAGWQRRKQPERKLEFPLTVCKVLWKQSVAIVIPRLLLVAFTFAQPFLIAKTLNMLSQKPKKVSSIESAAITAATAIVFIGLAVLRLHYHQQVNRFTAMFRGAAVAIIYRSALQIEDGLYDESAAVTIMSTDVDQIAASLTQVNECWARLIEVLIGTVLLARELGYICAVTIILVIVSFLGIREIAKRMGRQQKKWVDAVQKRIALTSSMLVNIRNFKVMGLGPLLTNVIQQQRVQEVAKFATMRWLIVWQNAVQNMPWAFAPALTFIIFAITTPATKYDSINSEKIFTSLSIITLLTDPVAKLLSAIPATVSSMGSVSRVQAFLVKSSNQNEYQGDIDQTDLPDAVSDNAIELINIWAKHPGSTTSALRDVSVSIPKGSLTAVVGPVASGKSTLLKAVMKEITLLQGSVLVSNNSTAYCSQSAWLPNTTVKQAICHPFDDHIEVDETLYEEVIDACCLRQDISNLTLGDGTQLGSGSTVLSGGQKQRLALARSLYSRRPILLLDDVFGALDKPTQKSVSDALFAPSGICQRRGTTVVLATHSIEILPLADKVVVLNQGSIEHQGSYNELLRSGALQPSYFKHEIVEGDNVDADEATAKTKSDLLAEDNVKSDLAYQIRDRAVYQYYFRAFGWYKALTFVAFSALHVFAATFSHIWLKWWVDRGGKQTDVFIAVFVLLAVLNSIGQAGYGWSILIQITPTVARKLHYTLLKTVMRASPTFYAEVDAGSILNRFSQDMSIIETQLPTGVLVSVTNIIGAAAEAALIASGSSFMALTIPVLVMVVYVLQDIYLRTSKQLRLLDLEARAPLYSHFIETLDGLATIRAFGWQLQCKIRCEKLLDDSQKPHYMLLSAQAWLNMVLDLIVASEAIIVIALATSLQAHTNVSLLGVALNNILSFNASLSSVIGGWTLLETSLGSIARLQSLEMQIQPEDIEEEFYDAPDNWPSRGEIRIQGLGSRHNPSSIAITDVNLTFTAGQKVGICGRTGSGKSSLISTIARMTEITEGSIEIDGVDLTTVSKNKVRESLTFVPQDAPILHGTLRFNADPEASHSDAAIIDALTRVGLWAFFAEKEGLDEILSLTSLSHGQRQMLSLARAILKKSKILLLDEPTSNIDEAADTLLQTVLREEFADCTVITVAHRINTIYPGSDFIVVMDEGRVAEAGRPDELRLQGGIFANLVARYKI